MDVLSSAEPEAQARLKAVGRRCGACSLCCQILGVDEPPAFSKPPDRWCPHCRPGKGGCTIYDERLVALRASSSPASRGPGACNILLTVGSGVGAECDSQIPENFWPNSGKVACLDGVVGVMRHWQPSNNPPVTLLPSGGN
jgi:hypothetical protein